MMLILFTWWSYDIDERIWKYDGSWHESSWQYNALEIVRWYDIRHDDDVFMDNMVVRYEFVLYD